MPLDNSRDAVAYLKGAFDEYIEQEQTYVILLNVRNYPLGRTRVSIGTATNTFMNVREVFRAAIIAGATAIILAHNHPSGVPIPSRSDILVTGQIRKASQIVGIELQDHLIVCPMADDEEDLFFSFEQNEWGTGLSVEVPRSKNAGRCRLEVLTGGVS